MFQSETRVCESGRPPLPGAGPDLRAGAAFAQNTGEASCAAWASLPALATGPCWPHRLFFSTLALIVQAGKMLLSPPGRSRPTVAPGGQRTGRGHPRPGRCSSRQFPLPFHNHLPLPTSRLGVQRSQGAPRILTATVTRLYSMEHIQAMAQFSRPVNVQDSAEKTGRHGVPPDTAA